MIKIKISQFLILLILGFGIFSNAKATEECFEDLSRSVFKFNMAFDNIFSRFCSHEGYAKRLQY